MNSSEHEIESALRGAPQPKAPAGLEQKLIAQIPKSSAARQGTFARAGWLQRWWPALGPAALSLACAAVITSQQIKISDIQHQVEGLSQPAASASVSNAPTGDPNDNSSLQAADPEQAEIQRLKQVVANLSQEIGRLEQMKGENDRLRAQLANSFAANLTPQEKENLQKIKERADSINCINNLKQIGLALRVWSLDNEDAYPPNFLVTSNELSTPKILVCPSDTAHQAAPDFRNFGPANCSYEYFAPLLNDKPGYEPMRVMLRCPVHGHIGLSDGSVQSFVAKTHPEQLVQRDGKLWYVHDSSPGDNQQPGSKQPGQ